jgi:DNA repair exonuclease SbcCD ATPase subunit
MNLTSVYFRNLFSYSEVSLSLEGQGLYLLLGKNGVGKSAFREGITWCLFGESRYGNKPDSIVKDGEEEAEATIGFKMEDDGEEYIVTRSRGRGKTTKLSCNHYTGQTLKETQEYICSLLGMDYNVFRNTACFEQGGADSFSKLTPKEAKDVLLSLLQLGVYEKACEKSKEKLKVISQRVISLTDQKMLLESSEALEEENVVKERLKSSREKLKEAETLKLNLEQEILGIDSQLTKYQIERQRLRDEVTSFVRQKITPVETRLGDLKRQKLKYSELKVDSECPTCQQTLTKEHIEKLLSDLEERIDKGTEILTKFDKEAAEKKKVAEEMVAPYELSDSYTTLKERLSREILPIIGEAYSHIGRDEGILQQLAKGKERVKKIVEELEIEKARETVYEQLVQAFGRNGIPAFIIENSKPEIEEVTNMLLGALTEGKFKVSIATEKALKSGKSRDTLDIMISNGVHERPYIGYSGGERFLVDFCLRIALSVILSNRHNARVQTLIIDEGLGSLDDNNRRRFGLAVQQVFRMFSFRKCFLITHSTDIQDSIGEKIYIVKEGGSSRIQKEEEWRT